MVDIRGAFWAFLAPVINYLLRGGGVIIGQKVEKNCTIGAFEKKNRLSVLHYRQKLVAPWIKINRLSAKKLRKLLDGGSKP